MTGAILGGLWVPLLFLAAGIPAAIRDRKGRR